MPDHLFSLKNCGLIVFFVLAGSSLMLHGQGSEDISARITTWYGNKPGAVSVTFDDACYSQFEYAYPILRKYNIKGTFSVVGEWVNDEPSYSSEPGSFEIRKMGWPQLAELYENGHELSAHGYSHVQYDKRLPVSGLAAEMLKIKSLIESKIPCRVFTIHYPYSYASENIPLAAKAAGFLFGRTGLDTFNLPDPADMYLLASQVVLNETLPDSVLFGKWLEQSRGNWLILMYHHFFTAGSKEMALYKMHNVKNTYSILPGEFDRQMETLAASGCWIAPVCETGKYITQRENTEVRIIGGEKKIIVYTVTNLDKTVYDVPLTIEVIIPWKRVKVEGSLNDGIFEADCNRLYINALPETEVILTKE